MKRPTRRTLLIGAAVAGAGGVAGSWLPYWGLMTYGLTQPKEMERAITSAVPVGSPIAAADAFLRREGFRRASRIDEVGREGRELRDGGGTIWFYRDDGGFLALVFRNWRVRVDHRAGCVAGYATFTYLTGL